AREDLLDQPVQGQDGGRHDQPDQDSEQELLAEPVSCQPELVRERSADSSQNAQECRDLEGESQKAHQEADPAVCGLDGIGASCCFQVCDEIATVESFDDPAIEEDLKNKPRKRKITQENGDDLEPGPGHGTLSLAGEQTTHRDPCRGGNPR